MTHQPLSKTRMAILLPLGVIVFSLTVLFLAYFLERSIGQKDAPHNYGKAALNQKISLEKLTLSNQTTLTLREEIKKGRKIFLVNFWASWCSPCIVEMPSIVQLYNRYRERGLMVIGINLDDVPEKAISKTLKRIEIPFPIAVDTTHQWTDYFDVSALPFTVIFDRSLKILHMERGDRDWDDSVTHARMDRWLKYD